MKPSKLYFQVFLIFLTNLLSSAIKGYNLADNKMNVRMGPHDGYLRAEMSGLRVPPELTVCLRFHHNFSRHGDQQGLWHIFIPNDTKWPIFNIACNSKGWCSREFRGYIMKQNKEDYPKVNFLRKWSSMCVGLDFLNDHISAFFNGKEVNTTALEKYRNDKGTALDSPLVSERIFFRCFYICAIY